MHSSLTNEIVLAHPNNYMVGRGGYKICKITPHHMAGVLSGSRCAKLFQNPNRIASANYCIGVNGDIVCNVDENNRAFTSSNYLNDCQAITIEVSNSSVGGDWPISQASWNSLVKLCVDICKRYGFRLNFTGDYQGSLTMHKMFANTSCPGPYLSARMNQLANEVNAQLDGAVPDPGPSVPNTAKYGVGTPVCTNTLWSSAYSGASEYKGDWQGTITRVIPGAPHPYLLNNGTGWTNDVAIDSDPHIPGGGTTSGPDQILQVGSVVESVSMAIAEYKNTGSAIVYDGGVECVNVPALGGIFPTKYLSEASDTKDGKHDDYLANTASRVVVNRTTVQDVDAPNNLVKIHDIWVKPGPLVEL